MTRDAQIAALRKRQEEISRDIAALERGDTAPAVDDRNRGPSIRFPARVTSLPSADEFSRLLEIVTDRYPQLAKPPSITASDYSKQFQVAFTFLQSQSRRDRLDVERDLIWWSDASCAWCRTHSVEGAGWMTGAALLAAVIACGDIQFSDPSNFPLEVRIAVQAGGGGNRGGDWWRRALAGTLLEPLPNPFARLRPGKVAQR
jgi:hypothetical protein